ncbi:CHASE domain-containing protein [Telluria aromaticivorans]|uniref:histidine kinase n=1 Tax=Telluria aromaticivorans TaxID=2725995 RepID=A0A7Y2JXX8_9BURK|nr:CHASE domain-containing protein [Telluria aromaticivorans]NNG22956.1 PAS domain S-box protein [Telluria aromaticivorans]
MPQSSPADTSRIPLPGSGQVPLLLALLVLLVTLIVTFSAWSGAQRTAQAQLLETFDYRTRDMAVSISRRMAVYEQVLRGARGYLRGSVDVSRREWEEYYRVLRLDQSFPGLEALGISVIVPPGALDAHVAAMRREGFAGYAVHPAVQVAGPRPVYTAIKRIEPFTGRNLRAFGYDMFSEPVRRAAMVRARDSGQAALSGKVVLIQDGKGAPQASVVMYLPVYRAGELAGTVEQRRNAIAGWVYAPFRMNDLMQGLGGAHSTDLDIEIHDGEPIDGATLIYRSTPAAVHAPRAAGLKASAQIMPGGRTWTISMRSSAALENSVDSTRPLLIAITGTSLGVLLSIVVWLLARQRRGALQLAQGMTLELRESHDQVAAEQKRMQVILENAPDAFLALDSRGRITDWNAQATRLFGWSVSEAIGREAGQLLPEDRRAAFRSGFEAFASSGQSGMLGKVTELTVLDRHGRPIPAELTVAKLAVGNGFGATAFVRDITPRKETEAREQQRQQRLDEARQALSRSQKLEAVGKLTGGVAHDFNNILHIISANVQLMLRADGANRKRLLSILDAVDRGSKLAGQLLAFARRQPLHPTSVDIGELLERMDSLVLRAAGDSIRLEKSVPPGLWPTLVDPNQLENVLLNLVINARDAMDGSGRITLALSNVTIDHDSELAPGDYVAVAIADSGHGMPVEVMERAFEPFFTTKPEGKGTGLGLSMAHGFARQSGGDIRLASEPGKGTTVTIYLPRHVVAARPALDAGVAAPY